MIKITEATFSDPASDWKTHNYRASDGYAFRLEAGGVWFVFHRQVSPTWTFVPMHRVFELRGE